MGVSFKISHKASLSRWARWFRRTEARPVQKEMQREIDLRIGDLQRQRDEISPQLDVLWGHLPAHEKFVRIINGEIVSDNDPRVTGAQRRSGTGATRRAGGSGGGRQSSAGYGRIASLHDPPAPSDGSGGGRSTSRDEAGQEGEKPGVMDTIAEKVGMQGRFITIPGALGVPEQRVHLLYLLICAIAVLFGGLKIAGVIVFAYIIINQKGKTR